LTGVLGMMKVLLEDGARVEEKETFGVCEVAPAAAVMVWL